MHIYQFLCNSEHKNLTKKVELTQFTRVSNLALYLAQCFPARNSFNVIAINGRYNKPIFFSFIFAEQTIKRESASKK